MNVRLSRKLCLILVLLWSGPFALACLWDEDTRSMEEQRFPDTLALITGGFLRHSHYFYEWRIEQRLKEIEQQPDKLELYDDLAVAYEKTGNTAKAIEVAEELLKRDPDRYETLANLGTFYIHNGELERGVEFIDKALEVNPDAHFGRERYQKYVVEYVLSRRDGEKLQLPLEPESRMGGTNAGFTEFLFNQLSLDEKHQPAEVKKAIQGVLGMMRFGNYDSPILLECLGDLLMYGPGNDSSLHLASRAYLKASYEADSEEARKQYREIAQMAASSIYSKKEGDGLSFADLEKQFKTELANAETWVQEVFADEQRWIAEGADVEQRYAEKYYTAPAPAPDLLAGTRPPAAEPSAVKRSLLAGVVIVAVLAVFLFWAMSRQYAKVKKANQEQTDLQ